MTNTSPTRLYFAALDGMTSPIAKLLEAELAAHGVDVSTQARCVITGRAPRSQMLPIAMVIRSRMPANWPAVTMEPVALTLRRETLVT